MSGRPLRGTLTTTAAGFTVSVPRVRGEKARVSLTFDTREGAERWRTLAIDALHAGEPLPDRPAHSSGRPSVPGQGSYSSSTSFAEVADAWVRERYIRLRRGDASRRGQVEAIIRNHILPFFAENGLHSGDELIRDTYVEFLVAMVGPPPVPRHPRIPETGQCTVEQAAHLCGVSVSTIKRRRRTGKLPGSTIDPSGVLQIPHSDLITAQLTPARTRGRPVKRHGLSVGTAKDIREILDEVLFYGREVFGWTLQVNPGAVDNARAPRTSPVRRTQVTLADTARIAEHLHVVHQIALWLMRVCGLRISEAYGIRLVDVVLESTRGVVKIHRQGGQGFQVYDGDKQRTVTSKDVTKTAQSVRALIIPAPLATLIKIVIEVFHTDPDTGVVDPHQRLIPGLALKEEGGQSAFRSALKTAAQHVDVSMGEDPDENLLPVPHDLRKGNLTDLAWADIDPLVRKRWGGHAAGSDVAHRVYVLDHPDLAPFLATAKELEALIDTECGGSLLVPTSLSCTTGNQRALARDSDRIDAALLDAGWLVPPRREGEGTQVDVEEVAELLACSLTTARRWVADHPGSHKQVRGHLIAIDDVLDERQRRYSLRTVDVLAEELDVTYNTLYYWIERDHLDTETRDGRLILSEATDVALRRLHQDYAELRERAMSLPDAAAHLHVTVHVVDRLIRAGHLTVDPNRGPRNARYVTRESVDVVALHQQRSVG